MGKLWSWKNLKNDHVACSLYPNDDGWKVGRRATLHQLAPQHVEGAYAACRLIYVKTTPTTLTRRCGRRSLAGVGHITSRQLPRRRVGLWGGHGCGREDGGG